VLSSLTLAPSKIQSQQTSVATATLNNPATGGGVTLELSTSNSDVAGPRVSSITIPAGSTTGTFSVDAHTVSSSSDIQITALQRGVTAINAILRVTIFPPVARFTITGSARGDSRCTIENGNGDLDCRLDASASGGVPLYYRYNYTIGGGSGVNDVKSDAMGDVEISTGCDFLKDHGTSTDDNGDKYLSMVASLVIEDREGTLSSKTSHDVRVYTNGFCGY
jgi:hypothetical protein